MGALSNCGGNEHGGTSGGSPGDQTGKEWHLIPWYSRPWYCVLRHPNAQVRATLSRLAVAAAQNDHIGYDQPRRTTYWHQLSSVGYDPSKITTNCDADCSSGVCSNIKAAGYLLGIDNLKSLPILATGGMRSALTARGFQLLTGSQYTGSSASLIAGDVLLNDGAHTAMWTDSNVGDTSGMSGASTGSSGTASGSITQELSSMGIGSYDYSTRYTVKSGDTIYSIASKYGITQAMILWVNNISPNDVKAGKSLIIPKAKGGIADPASGTNPITKRHTSGILVDRPVIEAKLYTEQGLLATVSTTGLTSDTDFDNELISINTTRDMSQDCPTFTLNVVYHSGWYSRVSPNDLVVISMQRPPDSKHCVMVGLVDDIRKVLDFSSGQPQRAVQITGRGMNKALVNFDVGLLENISIDTGTGFFADLVNLASCDSYDAIDLVQKDYIGRAVRYSFADGSTITSHYQYQGDHHEGEVLTDYEAYSQYTGSLWNFIKSLGNSPWCETYWDVNDSEQAVLVHRYTPFNKDKWTALDRYTLKDTDIMSNNTGRSDLETYTLYSVYPVIGSSSMVNLYMPLWYPPFAYKYGITQLIATTSYQSWGSYSGGMSGSGSSDSTDDSSAGGTIGNGRKTVIPSSVNQTGIIGDYTGLEGIHWAEPCRTIYNKWVSAGRSFVNKIAVLNGRYLVAVRPQFGSVGSNIDIVLADNTVIHATIMDTKGSDASTWGHDFGGGAISIVEFEAKSGFRTADVPSEWRNKHVSYIVTL